VEANGPTPPEEGSPEALEQEAQQQGAFNPETGEINWDCPCLGGMADGPCGEEFKAAFSCFVYSKEEPKGMDCIDKFQHMQDCFRLHPEVYGEELAEDDEAADSADETPAPEGISARNASAEGSIGTPAAKPTPEPTKTTTPTEQTAEADVKTGEAKQEGGKAAPRKTRGASTETNK
jgi:intermembrane space import and assembly protein 40